MDLSRTKAPPGQRGRNYQNARGPYCGRYGGNRGNYQGFPRANVTQTNNRDNTCFRCGLEGHYARNCPNKGAQANLIDLNDEDQQSEYTERSGIEELVEKISNLSIEEKQQVAQGMNPGQDFLDA